MYTAIQPTQFHWSEKGAQADVAFFGLLLAML